MPADRSSPETDVQADCDVLIVGGGASGAILAMHLATAASLRIVLADWEGSFGRGLAYRTRQPLHLLNTRSTDMSVWPEQPNDFVDWLSEHNHRFGQGFVPRGIYGDYLEARFHEAVGGAKGRLTVLQAEVSSLAYVHGAGIDADLAGRSPIRARHVVLATGHNPPSASRQRWIGDPWDQGALASIPADGDVLLLGTGLTAMDVLVSLLAQGHRGKIIALSRRGLLPRAHGSASHSEAIDSGALCHGELSKRLFAFRRLQREGHGWAHIMHTLRPHNTDIWQRLDEVRRGRFLRHLRPWWDVHRHRMPQQIARLSEDAVERGQLSVMAGRLLRAEAGPAGMQVTLHPRGEASSESLTVQQIVDCRGSVCGPNPTSPLLTKLKDDGLIETDILGLGITVSKRSTASATGTREAGRIHILGPPARGFFWESTAIPDIRRLAASMSSRLVAELVGTVDA